jgi:hypothetical protein
MDTNQINGVKLFVIGTFMILVIALLDPKDQIIASAAVGCLFAFGGMLVSGNWPYTAKRPRRRRIGQSRLDFYLQPLKDLVFSKRTLR